MNCLFPSSDICAFLSLLSDLPSLPLLRQDFPLLNAGQATNERSETWETIHASFQSWLQRVAWIFNTAPWYSRLHLGFFLLFFSFFFWFYYNPHFYASENGASALRAKFLVLVQQMGGQRCSSFTGDREPGSSQHRSSTAAGNRMKREGNWSFTRSLRTGDNYFWFWGFS